MQVVNIRKPDTNIYRYLEINSEVLVSPITKNHGIPKNRFWLSQIETQLDLLRENDFILILFRLLLRKQFDNAALELDFEFFYFSISIKIF